MGETINAEQSRMNVKQLPKPMTVSLARARIMRLVETGRINKDMAAYLHNRVSALSRDRRSGTRIALLMEDV